ncbi:L,D-transpeptidase [Leucothrix pacifica]|uniref:L,D-TPase catalytic domain-containing protein n=1 Tax=Leucothrix pacifica TaxID=1247513 RepID=A0A317C2G8_9GAMM|nr:L,D-transpeptidase [Leucothrix pacifica]PWQ92866.1 hypothetical protein DKW60_19170 [Leucothrix pacifica]
MNKQPVYSSLTGNQELLDRLFSNFSDHISNTMLLVNISQQCLYHLQDNTLINKYIISSALNGVGSENNSGKTPLGAHCIQEKFGDDAPIATIFRGRVDTGELANILTDQNTTSDADNITSRILRLAGLEPGLNQGDGVDSYNRYIYIHGTDEEGRLGHPASHGCIRMANQDIINLYPTLELNTFVYIFAA